MGEVVTRPAAQDGQPLVVHKDGLRFFPGANAVLGPLNALVNWGRCGSIWPVTFGLACCAIEMMATGASTHDLDRFGIIFRVLPGFPWVTPVRNWPGRGLDRHRRSRWLS